MWTQYLPRWQRTSERFSASLLFHNTVHHRLLLALTWPACLPSPSACTGRSSRCNSAAWRLSSTCAAHSCRAACRRIPSSTQLLRSTPSFTFCQPFATRPNSRQRLRSLNYLSVTTIRHKTRSLTPALRVPSTARKDSARLQGQGHLVALASWLFMSM